MQEINQQKINQAKEALRKHESKAAIKLLEPFMDQEVTFEVNCLYVQALLAQQRYSKAYQEALVYERQYLQSSKTLGVWIDVLVHNQLFIPARLAISYHRQQLAPQLLAKYEQVIEQQEQQYQQNQSQTIQQTLKNFYHIGDQPYWNQEEAFTAADRLPLTEYVQGAQFVLRDPFANPLLRGTIMHTLVELGCEKSMKLIWLNGKELTVIPAGVQNPEHEGLIQNLYHDLEQRLGNDNPTDYKNYLQQLQLQMLVLYPFENLAITDPSAWIDVLLDNQKNYQDEAHKKALNWQQKIMQSLA